MKVMIDKQGGTHYHKKDCPAIKQIVVDGFSPITHQYHYEEIAHKVRRFGMLREYGRIVVDGKYYNPCLICFKHNNYKEE